MKRKWGQKEGGVENETTPTPKRSRRLVVEEEEVEDAIDDTAVLDNTPSKNPHDHPKGNTSLSIRDLRRVSATPRGRPKGKEKLPFTTPVELRQTSPEIEESITLDADRSARRKTTRNFLERTIAGDLSDDNGLDEEDNLAQQIWQDEESEENDNEEEAEESTEAGGGVSDGKPTPTATPSKRGPGRPKGARKKRTPTPPANMPPHEQYFFHNRPGKVKTSSNTVSSLSLLTHSSYHDIISSYEDPHADSIAFLHDLHTRAFPQWAFELSQNFSLCLYGYGSKRLLVTAFADYLHSATPASSPPTTIIINGYHPTYTPTTVLTTILSTLSPAPSGPLSAQPALLAAQLLSHLTSHPPQQPLYLLFNSIDAPPSRRPANQALLASLAAHPSIYLLATADQPSFPLLWDPALRAQFNFLFHDATTFVPYDDGKGTGEVGGVVDTVHELMGRRGGGRRGRDGVGWVLRSLPENARGVYRLLVGELLAGTADDDDGGAGASHESDDDDIGLGDEDAGGFDTDLADGLRPLKRPRTKKSAAPSDEVVGVSYKTLYQKAVEEFLCSSEMAFRTLLKEFHDHQMVVSRRDGGGDEVLGVPMRREELEGVLEDLVG